MLPHLEHAQASATGPGLLPQGPCTRTAHTPQGLRRRKEVATARSLLDLMQDLAHVATKVGAHLGSSRP